MAQIFPKTCGLMVRGVSHILYGAFAAIASLPMSDAAWSQSNLSVADFSMTHTALDSTLSPYMKNLLFPSLTHTSQTAKTLSREQRDGELSVLSRKVPEYNPQNIILGEYVLAPSLETGIKYDDNVYATNQNQREDMLYTMRPELILKSNFLRHELNGDFYLEEGRYHKLSDENYRDYGATVAGRYDLYQGLSVPLTIGYLQAHSRRDDPDERRNIDPSVYNVFTAGSGITLSGHNIEFNGRIGFQDIQYDDTTSFAGFRIDNSDRNRSVVSNYVSLGLPQEARIAPFIYASHKRTTYEVSEDDFGIARDSTDIEGGIGTVLNLTSLSRSTLRIGEVRRSFDDDSIDDVTATTFLANISWDATTLMSFNLSGGREIRETSANAAAQLQSSALLGLTYELSPNLFLKPKIGYLEKAFIDSDLKSKAYTANMEVLYKLNPNIWTTLEYEGLTQKETGNSGIGVGDFDENTVSLSLKFQL